MLGTTAVVVIYLSLNLLYVYAIPLVEIGQLETRVVDEVAGRLFGSGFSGLLAAASAVMIAASLSAMILAGPRVYYAMARDGLFFAAAGRVHPRLRTPVAAIIAQSIWSGILVLAGTFEQLLLYTGFALVMFTGAAVLALFVLRRRDPDASRPFRAWGYPVGPAVFVISSAAMVVNFVWREPVASGVGLLLIGAGVPLYWIVRGMSADVGERVR